MELNKKELKIIIYDFRVKAKALLNTPFQDFNSNLKRFMNYLKDTELINCYILSNVTEEIDMAKEFKEISDNYGRAIFDLGITEKEEVSNIYQILKYICDNNYEVVYAHFLSGYCSSNKYQDRIDAFNTRVIDLLITHIESYLRKIGIEMGMEEEIKYMIEVNNGNVQINNASGNATLNAEQKTTINYNELFDLATNVEKQIEDKIEETIKIELKETLECIKDLATSKNSSPSIFKLCKTTLTNILPKLAGFVNLAASITTILDYINTYYG